MNAKLIELAAAYRFGERPVRSVAVDSAGRILAGLDDGRIRTPDLEWKAHEGPVVWVGHVPNGARSAGADGGVRFWDATGKPAGSRHISGSLLRFGRDGGAVFFQRGDGALVVRDLESGSERVLAGHWPALDARFTSDGTHLVTSRSDEASFWDLSSGRHVGTVTGVAARFARLLERLPRNPILSGCRWVQSFWNDGIDRELTSSDLVQPLGRGLAVTVGAQLVLWDRLAGRRLAEMSIDSGPTALSAAPGWIAVGHSDGRVTVVRFNPEFDPVRDSFLHAVALDNLGDPAAAMISLRCTPEAPETLHLRAHLRQETGDVDAAIADFTEGVRLKANLRQTLYCRGLAHQRKGDLRAAATDFKESLRLNRETAQALFELDGTRSTTRLKRVLALDPRHVEALIARGQGRRKKGDFEGAIDDFTESIRLQPRNAEAFRCRGECRLGGGDADGALDDFDKALLIDPADAEALSLRGRLFQERGSWREAAADFGEAIRINPRLVAARIGRGAVREKLGDRAGAVADFEEALRLTSPGTAEHGVVSDELLRLRG